MNQQEENKEMVNELTIKFLVGDISTTEMSLLEKLLNTNPENRKVFRGLHDAWISSSLYLSGLEPFTAEDSWKKVKKHIEVRSVGGEEGTEKKRISLAKIFSIAASWLLLISAGALLTWTIMNKNTTLHPSKICEISTPLGSRSHMILPDGSEVWLNAGTTFQYPATFSSGQRDVFLTGEAYFKVKADKKRPFIVHAAEVRIKALGTAFNVKAYPTDKTIVATLVEGIVNLENERNGKKIFTYTLKPREKFTYYKNPEIPKYKNTAPLPPKQEKPAKPGEHSDIVVNENVNTTLLTSWKDARWVIAGESLDNLAILLERRFGVKINVASEELSRYKFSGTIEDETLEQVLEYLKLSTPIKYTIRKGYVDLSINETIKDNYRTFLKESTNVKY